MKNRMEKKVYEVYCNSCGKKIETTDSTKREDYISIKKEWGYFSNKDGQIHIFHICESCYDTWTGQFRIPVKVEEQTELLQKSEGDYAGIVFARLWRNDAAAIPQTDIIDGEIQWKQYFNRLW